MISKPAPLSGTRFVLGAAAMMLSGFTFLTAALGVFTALSPSTLTACGLVSALLAAWWYYRDQTGHRPSVRHPEQMSWLSPLVGGSVICTIAFRQVWPDMPVDLNTVLSLAGGILIALGLHFGFPDPPPPADIDQPSS